MIKNPAVIFLLLALLTPARAHRATEQRLEQITAKAGQAYENFLDNSFELRMYYEFTRRLPESQNRKLRDLAGESLALMEAALADIDLLIDKMARYEGSDWEQLYFQTGLWPGSRHHRQLIELSRAEIRFWQYLARAEPERLLEQLPDTDDPAVKYLQARVLESIGSADKAADIFEDLLRYKNDHQYDAVVEYTRLNGGNFAELARHIVQSPRADDYDLVLRLAFAWNRHDDAAFGNITDIWPDAGDMLANVLLQNLKSGASPDWQTPYAIELAALAAWNCPEPYSDIWPAILQNPDFRRPVVLYAAAVDLADRQPEKSTQLLIEASAQLADNVDPMLGFSGVEIASQAARLAIAGRPDCQTVLKAAQNYLKIADNNADSAVLYAMAGILDGCDYQQPRLDLLQKLSGRSDEYSVRAQLDLMAPALGADGSHEPVLVELIAICRARDWPQVAVRAKVMYAELLLDTERPSRALEVLASAGQRQPAARAAIELVENFEKYAGRPENWAEFATRNLRFLHEIDQKVTENDDFFTFLTLELQAIAGRLPDEKSPDREHWDIPELQKLRLRARQAKARGDYEQAAGLWAQLGRAYQNRCWHWWRAKYYELLCWGKCGQQQKDQARRAATVLLRSVDDIPQPWERLLAERMTDNRN